ncbi:MAG TPA: polysaccharide biosynthesis C-terminal domain-containing protein, partial [Candidatus Nanoarchaeia archaeon]|nr:polysaccharide biosynthesis C-terminal domain-containing protein [Candidatus Nanoarchaeia archaeon]
YLSYSMKYFLLFAIPTATGLIVLANPLIQIISTKEFLSGYLLFPFIAVGLLLFKAAEVFMYILTSKKQTKLISKIYGFGALMNVILNFVFIPFFGMYGAAFTTFLTYLSILLIMFSKAYTQFKFNLNFKFMIKSVIASVIMGVVIYLFHITSLVMLLSIMLLGAIIYFLAIILMKGITRKELSFFYNFIKR